MTNPVHRGGQLRPALFPLLASVAGFGLAACLTYAAAGEPLPRSPEWIAGFSIAVAAAWLAIFLFGGRADARLRLWIQQFFAAAGLILILQAALLYAFHFGPIPWPIVAGGTAATILVCALLRKQCYPAVAEGGRGVLLLGFEPPAGLLAPHLKPVIGALDRDPQTIPPEVPYLGEPERLAEVVARMRPARVIVNGANDRLPAPPRLLLELRLSGIPVEDGLAVYADMFCRVWWRRLPLSAALFSPSLATHPFVMAVQAIYGNLAGLGLLVLLSPVMLATAAAVAVFGGRGPLLEAVECLGFQRVPFIMLRFRTRGRDGRETRVGRLLFRLRLIRLPQLINLVRGEMALFGPPPVRKEFGRRIEQLIPFYAPRFTVKPGILGWSQANLHISSEVPDEALRLEYDLYYVQEVIPALDLEILIRSLFRRPLSVR